MDGQDPSTAKELSTLAKVHLKYEEALKKTNLNQAPNTLPP